MHLFPKATTCQLDTVYGAVKMADHVVLDVAAVAVGGRRGAAHIDSEAGAVHLSSYMGVRSISISKYQFTMAIPVNSYMFQDLRN